MAVFLIMRSLIPGKNLGKRAHLCLIFRKHWLFLSVWKKETPHSPLNRRIQWSFCSFLMPRSGKPSHCQYPQWGYSSYQLRRVHQNWNRYSFGWMPPNNPTDRNGFGCAFVQAVSPWVGGTELERAIQNLSNHGYYLYYFWISTNSNRQPTE